MTTSIKYEVEQLYHYTSLNTLHAILQNKTIRLTDYRFLNDIQELFFATEKLKKYIQGNPTINEREELLTAVQNIESGKISKSKTVGYLGDKILISPLLSDTNYYVLSLSNARDNIAMWKMYAPEGCCMKFNSQKLFEFFIHFEMNIFHKDSRILSEVRCITEMTNRCRIWLISCLVTLIN